MTVAAQYLQVCSRDHVHNYNTRYAIVIKTNLFLVFTGILVKNKNLTED